MKSGVPLGPYDTEDDEMRTMRMIRTMRMMWMMERSMARMRTLIISMTHFLQVGKRCGRELLIALDLDLWGNP